jgi:A/G-specific adenine glycosylase
LLEHPDISASSLNQGLMELGEVVCVPNGTPHCDACPLHDSCIACREKLTSEIPYRSPLKKRSVEKRTLLVIRDGERFLMNKRPDTGLLASLYEFYGVEGHLSRADALKETEKLGLVPLKIHSLPDSKHIFTHKEWHMKAFEIMVEDASTFEKDSMFLVTKKELAGMAVPSAFKTYTDWFALRG